MAGYVRNDTANNISNGSVVDADDLDGEFNAIEGAFNAGTGHTHDGTAGSGGPILRIGPTQDLIAGATTLLPKTDNVMDLGSPTFEFKDLYIDGVANIDSLVADTADINAGTIDATVIGATTPAAATVTALNATSGVISSNSTSAALRVTQVGTGDALLVEDSANPDASPFVITTNGDVGIGTTTVANVAGYATLALNGTNGGNLEFRVGGSLVGEIFSNSTGNLNIGTQGAQSLFLRTSDANRLEIDSLGNVGVGTTISTVAGYTTFSLGNATDGGNIRLRNGSTTVGIFSNTATSAFLGTANTAQMRFGVGGNTQVNIDGTTGNVAFGKANTSADVVALVDMVSTTKGLLIPRMSDTQRNAIAAAPTGLLIYNTTSNRLEHFNGSVWDAVGNFTTLSSLTVTNNLTVDTNTLFVDSTNNRVGIGTLTPTVPLDIIGSVRAGSDTVAANYSVSIASGAANRTNFSRYSGNDGIGEVRHQGIGTFQFVLEGASNFLINTNGVERFRIEPVGGAWRVNGNYGTSGQVLTSNGSTSAPTWVTPTVPEQPIKVWVNFHGVPTSGTYSRTGTLVTVTMTAHGMSTGMIANLDFTTGTATDGSYAVTVVDANTFTITDTVSGATSGNVTRNTYIRKSFNVSSVTRGATGDYTINFASALADANYTFTASAVRPSFSIAQVAGAVDGGTYTTTALRVTSHPGNGTLVDSPLFTVIVVN